MACSSKAARTRSYSPSAKASNSASAVGELTRLRDHTAEVLVHHRQRPLRQVAEFVGEVGVDPADDPLLAVAAVLAERHLPQQEVADLVYAERLHQRHRVDDVADRLAHLLAAVVEEPVRKTRRGGGIPADIRKAGQYTVWNRMMSLPIMCRSAGQYR